MADKKSAWAGAGRNGSYNNESPLAVLKALAGMIGSASRSSAATSLGALGDLTRLGYTLTGNEQPAKGTTIFPDSSDVKRRNGIFGQQMIPNLPQDMRSSTYEGLGGMLPMTPELAGKIAMTPVGKGALAALAGMHGFPGAAGVIKPVGGQWLADSHSNLQTMINHAKRGVVPLSDAVKEKLLPSDYAHLEENMGGIWDMPADMRSRVESQVLPINKWVEGPMKKYLVNRMATPDDEIRKLADQGITHLAPWAYDAPYPAIDQGNGITNISRRMADTREQDNKIGPYAKTSFKAEQMAATPEGKRWEDLADSLLQPTTAGSISHTKGRAENPWLETIPQDTPVTKVSGAFAAEQLNPHLQFDHILDYISQATDPASTMPRELRLNPANLNKFSMEQAVKNTSAWNNHLAAQEEKANQAVANNPAHHLVKEYPEEGFKWVELAPPKELPEGYTITPTEGDMQHLAVRNQDGVLLGYAQSPEEAVKQFGTGHLEEALKFEGDSMGHCVGGYCDDVASGQTRIFSLRDKNGKPHVTIEANPVKREGFDPQGDWDKLPEELQSALMETHGGGSLGWSARIKADPRVQEWETENMPDPAPRIRQIKGNSNLRPNDAYQPYVTDFLKSQGPWSGVGDLDSTNGAFLPEEKTYQFGINNAPTVIPPGYHDIDSLKEFLRAQEGIHPDLADALAQETFNDLRGVGNY